MRTLVIPDIHNRIVSAQKLIDTIACDKIILLGDYFDSFGDNYQNANATAEWVRDFVIPDPKIVALLGNHDTHYFWPWNDYFKCSGYTDAKKDAIQRILNRENTKIKRIQGQYYQI